MSKEFGFSEEEVAVLRELLDEERGNLPAEIHHCRSGQMREELRARLQLVQGLHDRLSFAEEPVPMECRC